MATLKSGSTVGGSLVLTDSTHNNTGNPHGQYKLISELVAEYYDKTATDTLLSLKVNTTELPSLEQDKLDAESAAAAAAISETNAATSASNAAMSASQAATSASNASTSASEAATSEANAALSESNADIYAGQAYSSSTAAATSASNASSSAASAAALAVLSEEWANTSISSSVDSAESAATSLANKNYAEEWANKAEDSLVSTAAGGDGVNDYSALHWAAKAAASAAEAATFDPTSYYTKIDLDGGQLDTRYYTESEVDSALALKQDSSTLGTAAFKDVPSIGDAAVEEVVLGNDTRLTDARVPTAHNHDDLYYTKSEVGDVATELEMQEGTSTDVKRMTPTLVKAAVETNAPKERYVSVTSVSGGVSIDCSTGTVFSHALTEDTTFSFINPPTSGTAYAFTLKVVQDSTPRSITWPAGTAFAGSTAPTLSTGSGDVDIFVFLTHDGGTTWYGFVSGQVMS